MHFLSFFILTPVHAIVFQMARSHFTNVFVAVARLIFKDDSFNIFMKHLIQSVVSNSLVALFLFSIALLYTVVLFSFLQAIIFDSWQTLVMSKIKSTETFDPSKKNDAYFTRYLYGVVVLPFTLLVNLCSVQFWTNDALNELKRIFGIHAGPIETDVPWIDMLEALESLKLEQGTRKIENHVVVLIDVLIVLHVVFLFLTTNHHHPPITAHPRTPLRIT